MNHMPVDVVMYGCVLNACSVATEWRRALALLRDMENRGLQPNLVCYTSVITACQRAGEWRKALNILVRMQHGGPNPDVQVNDEGNMGERTYRRAMEVDALATECL